MSYLPSTSYGRQCKRLSQQKQIMAQHLHDEVQEYMHTNFPLHEAAVFGRVDVIRNLIEEHGYFVNEQTFDLVTPLHQACLHGHVDTIKLLIDKGAMINASNIDDATPLCDACCHGDEEVVKILLSIGANVNPPFLRTSPLHEAVLRDNWNCVNALLDAGANLEATDSHYGTALHIAAQRGNLKCLQILLQKGANVNSLKFTSTALHDVARHQDYEALKLLLDHGANVRAQNNQGKAAHDLVPSSTSPAKKLLLDWEVTVRSLQHFCRLIIRRELCSSRQLSQIDSLHLPKFLRDYLAFR